MEMILNELSIEPLSSNRYEANDRMIVLAGATKKAMENGFTKIRSKYVEEEIFLSPDYTLSNWLKNKEVSEKNYRDYFFGIIVTPFINDEDENIIQEYIKEKYYFEDTKQSFPKTECVGLASAYLYETISISFSSLPIWKQTKLPIIIEENGISKNEVVFNISSKESFEDNDIISYVENLGDITLEQTTILPNDKSQHLAEHHGIQELQSLCDRLKKSPYVIEMQSAYWGGKDFIRKIHSNGDIEIVLNRTDRRYALLVKTTGKNFRQTKAIAEILDDKYS
jgi:hypothetical protein